MAARIPLPAVSNFDRKTLMAMEKENLGIYLSDHPLNEFIDEIEKCTTLTSEDLADAADPEYTGLIHDGMGASVAGILVNKKNLMTKSGKMMAFLSVEDLYGIIEVIVFPNVYDKYQQYLVEDGIILIKGTLNFKEEEAPKIIADKIMPIEDAGSDAPAKRILKIRIDPGPEEDRALEQMKDVLKDYPGDCPVVIFIGNTGRKFKTSKKLWVTPDLNLLTRLKDIIGDENVKL